MLVTPLLRQHLLRTPWKLASTNFTRCEGSESGSGRSSRATAVGRKRQARSGVKNGKVGDEDQAQDQAQDHGGSRRSTDQPSLIEQLFPEETKRYEETRRKASREIPRLPIQQNYKPPKQQLEQSGSNGGATRSDRARRLEEDMRRDDALSTQTTVLVLRNASTNLVEEDFRRLIPQGRHMEGWTLEQGDIIKIVPGRNLATLAQENYYYLLFSSSLSAFTYQGHATRLFRLAASHTPSSMSSPMPPPPGYMLDGLDVHAAIESFALVPASQRLELRQLQPPLSPMVASIIHNKGYSVITRRRDNMPFEVRLTLEGPQIQPSGIRHILLATAKERSLAWSGGDEMSPRITNYEPRKKVSPMDHDSRGAKSIANANSRTEEEQMERDFAVSKRRLEKEDSAMEVGTYEQRQTLRRTPGLVYILGFYTEMAAQQFVQYWHRRPMEWKGAGRREDWEDDIPPVANAEMLW